MEIENASLKISRSQTLICEEINFKNKKKPYVVFRNKKDDSIITLYVGDSMIINLGYTFQTEEL